MPRHVDNSVLRWPAWQHRYIYTHYNYTSSLETSLFALVHNSSSVVPMPSASFQKPLSKLDQLVMVGCWRRRYRRPRRCINW